MRSIFRSAEMQRTFDERGWVVVPLLTPSEVDELRDLYDRHSAEGDGINPPGAYNDEFAEFSVVHSYPEFRRLAYENVTRIAVPRALDYLDRCRPLVANFVNKPPGGGFVPSHQNMAVTDEGHWCSVSVWIALVDCVSENGTLGVIDGSHRLLRGPRGMWTYRSFAAVEEELARDYLVPVPVPAGHAMILDDALVHGSPRNVAGERRLAIQLIMLPEEADACYFEAEQVREGAVDAAVWHVDEQFFWHFWDGRGDPDHGVVVDHVTVPVPEYDAGDLVALFGAPG